MMQTLSLPVRRLTVHVSDELTPAQQYTEQPAGDDPAYDNDATTLHLPNCVCQMELAELVKQQAPSLFADSTGAPTIGNDEAPIVPAPKPPDSPRLPLR